MTCKCQRRRRFLPDTGSRGHGESVSVLHDQGAGL